MRKTVSATAIALSTITAILFAAGPLSADDTKSEAQRGPGPHNPYCQYWPADCSPSSPKTDREWDLERAEFSEDLTFGFRTAFSPDEEQESNASRNSDEYVVGHQVAQAAPDDAAGGGDLFTDADEAARQSSNPLGGDFMILLNQWNLDFQQGDITNKTRNSYTHIFQPVVPIGLGGDWILVTRPTLPIIYDAEIPKGPNQFDNESGFGDIVLFSLLGTSTKTDFLGGGDRVLAGGYTAMFPTGSSEFTTDQYSLGPSGVAAFIGEEYIFGALGQHWWDIAEAEDDAPDVNQSNIQVFYYKNFSGGWQVGGAPQIEVDWEADSGDKWAVPIGLGVQKTQIMFGKMPVKFGVELQRYVVNRDTFGNEWRIQFTVAPILPNFIGNLLKGCPAMSIGNC